MNAKLYSMSLLLFYDFTYNTFQRGIKEKSIQNEPEHPYKSICDVIDRSWGLKSSRV